MGKEVKGEMEEILNSFLKQLQMKIDRILPQFEAFNSSVLNENREKTQKHIDYLNEELEKADEKIEKLKLEIERLRKGSQITKTEILQKMKEILNRAQHNVTIIVPKIADLRDLEVYSVRANVNRNIASLVEDNDEEREFLEELQTFADVRNYVMKDRYVILRDGEELLFGAIGVNNDINLNFHTSDAAHIKLFNGLALEAWFRSKTL